MARTSAHAPQKLALLARQLVELALPFVFTPEWRRWLTQQRASGASRDALLGQLIARGIPRALAIQALDHHMRELPDALLRIPERAPLADKSTPAAQTAHILGLRRALEGLHEHALPRLNTPGAGDFFATYYCANRPVVMQDFASQWPALKSWRMPALRARLGDHEVSVTRGREQQEFCDVHFDKLTAQTTLGEFIEEVMALGDTPSNDLYMIANNRNAEDPALLAALLKDVELPPGYFKEGAHRGSTSFWLGPAGTVTPMHHDTSNIVFCQVVGEKQFTLVSPLQLEMLGGAHHGFYSGVRAEQLEAAGIPHSTVVLKPGSALFIPVGWWHEVRALKPSVSVSFLNFTRPNNFTWYGPVRA